MADEKKKAVAKADSSETAKSPKKKAEGKSKIGGAFSKAGKSISHFFKDLRGETKKIVWPGRKMVIKSTGIVLAAILVIGVGIWLIDYAVSGAVTALNKRAEETTVAATDVVSTTAETTEKTTEAEDTTEAATGEVETTEVAAESTTAA